MFGLNNSSGIPVMPALKEKLTESPQWFTEGGGGVAPSYPGQDWFNAIQAEMLSILAAANIQPSPTTLNQISQAILELISGNINGFGELLSENTGATRIGTEDNQTVQHFLNDLGNKTSVLAQRPSFNALPRLLKALASYNESTDIAINIIGLGSSVGAGASLPNAATQAPVKHFASKLKAALDVGNVFNIASYNYSVNGSTISEYSAPLEQAVTDGKSPSLVVLAYGMNDSGVAIFNAGQTYPSIYTNAVKLIQRARELGSDVVIITTPHHRCNAITYYMPDGMPQMYPVYVAAPVSPESLIPPASQSNITGDFTGSGTQITVSHRHLRVNQMFRRIASDYGVPVIDAEYFWFKALEKYGEDALFNAGEYLHPNLLGHQQSYHAAIDMFIEGLQRQTSQSYEPRLSGLVGVNTLTPSAVMDIEIPYTPSPKPSLEVKARIGVTDGAGVKASALVWKVDETNGDLVGYGVGQISSVPIESYRVHAISPSNSDAIASTVITQKVYAGTLTKTLSGAPNTPVSTLTLATLPANCSGRIKINGNQSGVGRKLLSVDFVVVAGVVTLGAAASVGTAAVFGAPSASGVNLQVSIPYANTYMIWELEVLS